MKNKFTGIILGMILGALLMASVPAFGAAKQYILTAFPGKVVVNGVEYKDDENPILNHNGKTYLPLAKIGDLTGVQYRWNAELKQVEIGDASSNDGPAGRKNDYLKPDTVIHEDEEPGYKGYPDSTDVAIEWAKAYGLPQPPLLSDGWISESMLHHIEKIYVSEDKSDKNKIHLYKSSARGKTFLINFLLTSEFSQARFDETTVDGVRMKKHDREIYFNISDLQKAGIIE